MWHVTTMRSSDPFALLESLNCDFKEGTCDWEAQGGWTLSKGVSWLKFTLARSSVESRFEQLLHVLNNFRLLIILFCNNLLSDGSSIFLRRGAHAVRHSLFSPPNINTNEWKCLHLRYFIGGNDEYEASITVLLKMLTSNLTTLLLFADQTTPGTTYTQTPLPTNFTDAQVFTQHARIVDLDLS